MLSQGSQCAAGRAERSAARVGERSAPDRVVLEGAGLAAGAEVRVGRRFHGRHAGVIGVQVRVIHLIHGGQPAQTPVCKELRWKLRSERLRACLQLRLVSGIIAECRLNQSELVSFPPKTPKTVGSLLQSSREL